MIRLSKAFYLGSIAGGAGVGLGFIMLGYLMMAAEEPEAGLGLMALGMVPALYGAVILYVLCYKMWQAIQDAHARTTPGKAVGFLFIPFYNFYWMFQAFWGFAKDYNAFAARYAINAPRLPEGLFLAYPILAIAGMIPCIGILAGLAQYVVTLMMVSKICDAVNAIPPRLGQGPPGLSQTPPGPGY